MDLLPPAVEEAIAWLVTLRWPLVAILVGAAIYFLRRGPERHEAWRPPEPSQSAENVDSPPVAPPPEPAAGRPMAPDTSDRIADS